MTNKFINKPPSSAPSLLEVICSVLASMFGVQKNKNRERDFAAGKPWVFIVVGVIFTFLFVMGLIVVVKMVLASSGVT